MSTIAKILSSLPDAKGAAFADESGNVLESEGTMDADTVCAVAAMSMPTLDEAGDLLGLGNLDGWSIVTTKSALYVYRNEAGFVAVSGPSTKNPEAVLKKLAR